MIRLLFSLILGKSLFNHLAVGLVINLIIDCLIHLLFHSIISIRIILLNIGSIADFFTFCTTVFHGPLFKDRCQHFFAVSFQIAAGKILVDRLITRGRLHHGNVISLGIFLALVHDVGHVKACSVGQPVHQHHKLVHICFCPGVLHEVKSFIFCGNQVFSVELNCCHIAQIEGHDTAKQIIIRYHSGINSHLRNTGYHQHTAQGTGIGIFGVKVGIHNSQILWVLFMSLQIQGIQRGQLLLLLICKSGSCLCTLLSITFCLIFRRIGRDRIGRS